MYAIVRAGGRQEKVSVGDTLLVNKVKGEAGDSLELQPLLVVDGSTVTSDADKLAKVSVTAEVVGDAGLVLPLDIDAWSDAIDAVIATREELRVAGVRRVQQFTAEVSGLAVAAAYRRSMS